MLHVFLQKEMNLGDFFVACICIVPYLLKPLERHIDSENAPDSDLLVIFFGKQVAQLINNMACHRELVVSF